MENTQKIYDLGNGITFVTDNPDTIALIEATEADLLAQAEANEDAKKAKFYDRVKSDSIFRAKKVVTYALNKRDRSQHKDDKKPPKRKFVPHDPNKDKKQ